MLYPLRYTLLGRFGKCEMELAAEIILQSGDEVTSVTRDDVIGRTLYTSRPQVLVGLDELVARGWLVPVGEGDYAITPAFRERIRKR